MVGATPRTSKLDARDGSSRALRCEPTPSATPRDSAASARFRLMRAAISVPPVMHDAVDAPAHPIGGVHRGLEEGLREARETRAQGDRLRDVDAAPQAAAADDGDAFDAPELPDRLGRGDPPAGEELPRLEIVRALGLDARPARPSDAGGVEDLDARAGKPPPGGFRDAASNLFGDHRDGKPPNDLGHLREKAGEIALTLGLDGFLKGVQVKDESVGPDHRDRAAAVLDPVAVVELDGAQVREKRNRRSRVAHFKARRLRRIFERFAL